MDFGLRVFGSTSRLERKASKCRAPKRGLGFLGFWWIFRVSGFLVVLGFRGLGGLGLCRVDGFGASRV